MRCRLYYLIPDLASARKVMDDLLLARIEERHIHFIARPGTDLSGLHKASLMQTSDVVHGAESGLVLGGALGIVLGIGAAFYLSDEAPLWGVVTLLALIGAAFGAWVSSMIGVSVPNSRLKRFQSAIDSGQILLMVEVPRGRAEEIEKLLQRTHPEGHFEGVEPTIPAFP